MGVAGVGEEGDEVEDEVDKGTVVNKKRGLKPD
jgi:hypothetical protein